MRDISDFYSGEKCSINISILQITGGKIPPNILKSKKGELGMTDKVIENNQVTIIGEVVSDFSYSHEIYGEGFYMVDVKVQRLSAS